MNLIDPECAADVAGRIAITLNNPSSQRFFTANVAKWLRRRPDCAVAHAPGREDPHWAHEAHRLGRAIHRFALSQDAAKDLELLHSWVLGVAENLDKPGHLGADAQRRLNGLPAMSVDDALRKARGWRKQELLRLSGVPPRGKHGYNTKPLCTFTTSDGFVWEKLPAPDIAFVGYDLLNCLRNGAYHKEVALRIVALWALRDPDTGRFVTVLTTPGQSHSVLAVRGFRNSHPFAYKRHIQELLEQLGFEKFRAPDLAALGL